MWALKQLIIKNKSRILKYGLVNLNIFYKYLISNYDVNSKRREKPVIGNEMFSVFECEQASFIKICVSLFYVKTFKLFKTTLFHVFITLKI